MRIMMTRMMTGNGTEEAELIAEMHQISLFWGLYACCTAGSSYLDAHLLQHLALLLILLLLDQRRTLIIILLLD